ncbi:SPOR domain-containing protein [Roseovarius sp. Pro17]|uniref:SPOR domain-containing protein n=1 Tax=Roseovarius sp. Pro17 TaxID=3108175 RepID=UPI002D7A384B|nr:SPOR domain-containing protein [Roseovarius sp. Pro17]
MADFHAQEAASGRADDATGGAYGSAQTAPRWDDGKAQNPLSRATYAIGSIVSVGLVIGLGVWGYKLLVRDVSGVPVIRAAEGPMRIQPEDPGGRQTLNQGLSVNAVAAVGTAGNAPDELILAPAPLNLSEDDAPTAAPQRVQQALAETADASETPEAEVQQDIEPAEPEIAASEIAASETAVPETAEPKTEAVSDDMLALAEAISQGITPMAALEDAPNSPLPDADADAEEAEQPMGGIATSLRPRARPADLSNIRQVSASGAGAGVRDVDPESIATGTRLAQLGAFASEEIANEEWSRLGARFEEYLADKDRVIQKATSGGRTFYRLRAMGFDDLADARRFCSALVAEKAECIPVVTR